jgi:NDP-sugar pyrophosphorylase family protein
VRAAVGGGRAFGLKVHYSYEPTILGTGGGPKKVRRFFGDEPFLLLNGDVVFDLDLSLLVRRHRREGVKATLALLPNPDPKRYGAVITDARGRVRSLAGLPRRARGTPSLFAGIHVMDPALLDRLPGGASDSVRDLYAPMVAEGDPPLGVRLKGSWYDLGSPSLYLASHHALLAKRFRGKRRGALVDAGARVDPQAHVVRSVVGPGAVLAAGAVVRDSVLWDHVRVGEGASVESSILATSVRVQPGEAVDRAVVMRDQPLATLEKR